MGTKIQGTNLQGANLQGANLQGATLLGKAKEGVNRFIGQQPQYDVARWRFWVWIPVWLFAGASIGWLFFDNSLMATLIAFLSLLGARAIRLDYQEYCNQRALDEFYEMTVWLLAGYQSGKTLENTLLHLVSEWQGRRGLKLMYLGAIVQKWPERLRTGISGVELFMQMGAATEIAVIRGFSELMVVSHRHGGSAIQVIQMFHRYLREERLLAKEVEVVVSQKKLEHQLVSLAPLFFLGYMRLSAYAFVQPLYETFTGGLLMAAALALFSMMWLWGRRLVKCTG